MRNRYSSWLMQILLAATSVLAYSAAHAAAGAAGRTEQPLVSGWRFAFGDAHSEQEGIDDRTWEAVTLPHSWNRIGGQALKPANANEAKGKGWYRLRFDAPKDSAKPRRTWLQFDGASVVSDVWLNGVAIGRHYGAVGGFRFDISDAIQPGQNQLIVRTDNSDPASAGAITAETIPMSGDWFNYGGLYRKVSLLTTDPVHIDLGDHGGPGIYARTLSADARRARIEVTAKVRNDGPQAATVRLRTSIADANGHVVATSIQPLTLARGSHTEAQVGLDVKRPRLWNGLADPYLYQLRVDLLGAGAAVDSVAQQIGIRTMRFDPDAGFFLNGKKLALRGVNRHQESGANGWVTSAAELARDYRLIAEIGANTVRLAHYQHAQEEYELADRAGLLVWAEIPVVNAVSPRGKTETTPGMAAIAEEHLRELIRQNYNHPSIAVWSVANEANLETSFKFPGAPTLPLLKRLVRLARTEDAARPPVLASCCGTLPNEGRANAEAPELGLDTPPLAVDVFGINVYFGWYFDTVADLGPYLDKVHASYPAKTFGITEYGGGGALSQHSDNPLGGMINATGRPHPEQFQSYLHENSWPQISQRSYLWGSWIWNMFDFGSAFRQEGDLVDTNDKGLVSFDRTVRKESFYFYKAHWNPEPMLYLAGHRYTDRASPVADVKAYSNAASARLMLNGKDLGSTACANHVCVWRNVVLVQGENALRVLARHQGVELSDSATWRRADGPGSYRILAGQLAVTPTSAGLYGSDNFFTGGRAAFLAPPTRGAPPLPHIAGAADQKMYATYRSGRFSYDLPLPDGDYDLTLRFIEPVADQVPGKRVFNVLVQGQLALADFDPASAAAGSRKAIERTVPLHVSGGRAKIDFVPLAGAAILSSLSIAPR